MTVVAVEFAWSARRWVPITWYPAWAAIRSFVVTSVIAGYASAQNERARADGASVNHVASVTTTSPAGRTRGRHARSPVAKPMTYTAPSLHTRSKGTRRREVLHLGPQRDDAIRTSAGDRSGVEFVEERLVGVDSHDSCTGEFVCEHEDRSARSASDVEYVRLRGKRLRHLEEVFGGGI